MTVTERAVLTCVVLSRRWPLIARAAIPFVPVGVGPALLSLGWLDPAEARQLRIVTAVVVVTLAGLVLSLGRAFRDRLGSRSWLAVSAALLFAFLAHWFWYDGFQHRYIRDIQVGPLVDLVVLGDLPASSDVTPHLDGRLIPDLDTDAVIELMNDLPPLDNIDPRQGGARRRVEPADRRLRHRRE